MLTNYTIEPVLVCGPLENDDKTDKKEATPTRFELARAEPIGFQNQLLNHSDTVSDWWSGVKKIDFDSDEI